MKTACSDKYITYVLNTNGEETALQDAGLRATCTRNGPGVSISNQNLTLNVDTQAGSVQRLTNGIISIRSTSAGLFFSPI